MDERNNAKLA